MFDRKKSAINSSNIRIFSKRNEFHLKMIFADKAISIFSWTIPLDGYHIRTAFSADEIQVHEI